MWISSSIWKFKVCHTRTGFSAQKKLNAGALKKSYVSRETHEKKMPCIFVNEKKYLFHVKQLIQPVFELLYFAAWFISK